MSTLSIHNIKAISFDLDDTLYDNGSVIIQAFRTLFHYLCEHYPKVAQTYSFDRFLSDSKTFHASHPLTPDLSQLRRLHIQKILHECGYPTNSAEDAFKVFWQARQAVTLYPGVTQVLTCLAAKMSLVSISNGNACPESIGIDHFFQHNFNVANTGKPKPDSSMFLLACDKLAIKPSQLLHVGDSLEIDVNGAFHAGCRSVWFNPKKRLAENHHADIIIEDLSELLTISFT